MKKPGAELRAFDALVSGRVQGVGFRYSACREAQALGLSGWIRNTDDGEVEVHAEGERSSLDSFAAWLHEGPPGAFVTSVDISPCLPSGRFKGFGVDF
jgi:acylphosphatase